MSKILTPKKRRDIAHEQGTVPAYTPESDEAEHIAYIYRRRDEITKHYDRLGLFNEWATAEENYENRQKPKKRTELPVLNCGVELEVVETKSAEEKNVLPEVVLMPRYENDRVKAEAMQELFEHIKIKNQDDLKKFALIDNKNIYGIAYQEIRWKEQYRTIKEVTGIDGKEVDGKIPKLKWKEHRVLAYRDVDIQNIRPHDLLFSETATCIEDANECIRLWYGEYEMAKKEFGDFENFQYVKKGAIQASVLEFFRNKKITVADDFRNIECIGLLYWNKIRDEYSIILNGVLLTQYGNPIPSKYWKDFPFTRAPCRYMAGDRQFHPKGDVILVMRLKQLKSLLLNAITKSVVTNANAVLLATKEVVAKLKKLGKQWQAAGILETTSKENSQATKPIQVDSDPNGALALIGRIDEMITTLVGVDSRSLLTSVQETATKTAVRRETMLKRINAGLKLLEHETLHRKAKIILALIREYYEEEDQFLNKDELHLDNPSIIKLPKTISIKDKKFKWVTKYQPFAKDEILNLIKNGVSQEFISLIFVSIDGGNAFNFLADSVEQVKALKKYEALGKRAKDILAKTIEEKGFLDLIKSDTPGKVSSLEIKKELFDVPYDIHIVPKGTELYSQAFQRERLEKVAQLYLNTPFVKGEELARAHILSEGLDADKIVRTSEESAAEAQKMAQLKATEKSPQIPSGGEVPTPESQPVVPSETPVI